MPTRLYSVVVDANDLGGLARFWSAALGWPISYEAPDEMVVELEEDDPGAAGQIGLVFVPVPEPKTVKNRIHLDLATTSAEHQAAEVERLLGLGASRVDIGQGDDVSWVVLADPEGNELCVLAPHPVYEGTGPIAAIVVHCHDPAAEARFWTEATGWGLVRTHEQGEWALLRRPSGTGPYLEFLRSSDAKTVKNRIHLDVAPFPDDDQPAEVDRLVKLGARPIDIGQGDVRWTVLADPEDQEFCVLSPR